MPTSVCGFGMATTTASAQLSTALKTAPTLQALVLLAMGVALSQLLTLKEKGKQITMSPERLRTLAAG